MSRATARDASHLPLALWKAHLDLQSRIGRLLQDSGRAWAELGTRAAGEGVAEFEAQLRDLGRSGDWQALAALPVDALWRQAEQRLGDGQAWLQAAAEAQETFAGGLQEALQAWQRQTADAWAAAAGMLEGGLPPGFAVPPVAWPAAPPPGVGPATGPSPGVAAATPGRAKPAAAAEAPARAAAKRTPARRAAKPRTPASAGPAATGKGARKRGG